MIAQNTKLTLAYDGTNYAGWQIQPDEPTVQAVLQDALKELFGTKLSVLSAGRTDAGVHAAGQVANFRHDHTIPHDGVLLGLNTHLPPDVAVLAVEDVPHDFHATHDATTKTYRYVFHDGTARDPLSARFTGRAKRPLDADLMGEAAKHIVGRHDFACFETQGSPRPDTVRTVFDCTVRRVAAWNPFRPDKSPSGHAKGMRPDDSSDPSRDRSGFDTQGVQPFVVIEVAGDGFLYNMVRAIAGTLADVGGGKRPPESVRALIASTDRTLAGPTAPASGLCLVAVRYDDA
ncbi:MAG: tRNA pseudouridine(38-40) synthase TruA [Planctomycetota bacterium]